MLDKYNRLWYANGMDKSEALDQIEILAVILCTRCRSDFKDLGRNELLNIIHDEFGRKIIDLANATEGE